MFQKCDVNYVFSLARQSYLFEYWKLKATKLMGKHQSKIEETVAELQTPSEVASSTEPGQTKMESNVEEIKPEIKAEPGIVTNAKEVKDGVAYEVVIKPAPVPDKKPNIDSPVKEVTKEAVYEKLSAAENRRRSFENEKLHKIAAKMQHAKQVHFTREENVEQKTKEVAEKLEEKMKIVEAKQEAAKIALEKQRQAKQERFKDVLQQAHEKEEVLVKSTEEKLHVKTEVTTENREAILKGIKEQQQARFKKIEIAKNIREENQQIRSKDLEEKVQLKFLTANKLLEDQERARQERFEAEEERLRRARNTTEEKLEAEARLKAENLQHKMEKYKENQEAQRVARLEKLRAEELRREEVRLKKERNKASQG